jgi:hypothetical protein
MKLGKKAAPSPKKRAKPALARVDAAVITTNLLEARGANGEES